MRGIFEECYSLNPKSQTKTKMDELFKNKYRINSIRLRHWDYSWPAYYFVTTCIKDRTCCLCEI